MFVVLAMYLDSVRDLNRLLIREVVYCEASVCAGMEGF